jgi:hypothetical protein
VSDERLREVYEQILTRRAVVNRIHCVSPDELLQLAEHRLPTSRRLEVLDHVMGCKVCREEFQLLHAIQEARIAIERKGD